MKHMSDLLRLTKILKELSVDNIIIERIEIIDMISPQSRTKETMKPHRNIQMAKFLIQNQATPLPLYRKSLEFIIKVNSLIYLVSIQRLIFRQPR